MPADPFSDPAEYVRLPQLRGLILAPDGSRLVASVAVADEHSRRYVSALWEVDPEGLRPARQLTHGPSASAPTFAPDGALLYVSALPDPEGWTTGPALWSQPSDGGEARVLAAPLGGVFGVVVSPTGTVVLGSAMLPSATDAAGDQRLRAQRQRAGVSAMLHEEYPIRYWDHDLGPDRVRLLTGELGSGTGRLELRDLTGHVGRALGDECTWDLSGDGRTVAAIWVVAEPGGSQRHTLVTIDVSTGERRVLADDPRYEYHDPRFSPDGSRIAVQVFRRLTPAEPGTYWKSWVEVDHLS